MAIGYDVKQWDRSDLPSNVVLGAGCTIERQASFELFRSQRAVGMRMGSGVRVYTWTTFNVEPDGYLEVGSGSTLVGAVFMCAGEIRVGKRVHVSYQVTIADSDFHPLSREDRRNDARATAPFGDLSARPRLEARPVMIGDDVEIGIGAIILKGVRIGDGARIGAGSVITSDVEPGALVTGNPSRVVPEP